MLDNAESAQVSGDNWRDRPRSALPAGLRHFGEADQHGGRHRAFATPWIAFLRWIERRPQERLARGGKIQVPNGVESEAFSSISPPFVHSMPMHMMKGFEHRSEQLGCSLYVPFYHIPLVADVAIPL